MKFLNKIENIQPELYEECAHKGKVDRIDYQTTNYDGRKMDKYAFVYTPYDYDPTKKYEVLYLIHGGGEDAEKYIYKDGENNPLKRAIDNMIDQKVIEPLIIVTPSEYPDNNMKQPRETMNAFCSYFHNELVLDLIPCVEAKYHTYADFDTSTAALTAAKQHRNIMGWSMGCMTTWWVFANRINYFKNFGMLSCFCAEKGQDLTKEWADSTTDYIIESLKKQEVTKKDFNMYIITGTLDIVYEKNALQTAGLFAYPEYFDFYSEDQNCAYLICAKGEHHTQWRLQYTINAIKQFYQI